MKSIRLNGSDHQLNANSYFTEDGSEVVSVEASFQATLVAVPDMTKDPKTLKSGKKTPYRIVTGEFTNANDQVVRRSFMIWESNIQKAIENKMPLEAGESYLCTVIITEGRDRPTWRMSHLTGGVIGSFDDLGLEGYDQISLDDEEMVTSNVRQPEMV